MFSYEQPSQTTLSREALKLPSIFPNSYSVFCEFEPEMRNFVFASSFSRQHSDGPASNLVKIFERNVEDVFASNTAAFSSGIRQTPPICSLNLTACSSLTCVMKDETTWNPSSVNLTPFSSQHQTRHPKWHNSLAKDGGRLPMSAYTAIPRGFRVS